MKKTIFIIITLITILTIIIPNFVYSANPDISSGTGYDNFGLGDLDNYKGTNEDSAELRSKVGNLLGVIRAVGTVVSVVMLAGIGIKYLLGSVEEKADYKKSLIPYILGAAILFTGSVIPQLIYDLVKNL